MPLAADRAGRDLRVVHVHVRTRPASRIALDGGLRAVGQPSRLQPAPSGRARRRRRPAALVDVSAVAAVDLAIRSQRDLARWRRQPDRVCRGRRRGSSLSAVRCHDCMVPPVDRRGAPRRMPRLRDVDLRATIVDLPVDACLLSSILALNAAGLPDRFQTAPARALEQCSICGTFAGRRGARRRLRSRGRASARSTRSARQLGCSSTSTR